MEPGGHGVHSRRQPSSHSDSPFAIPDSRLALIAALDRNRAIGRAGAMPWHLSDDLKRFKALTLGKPVLMGRKTALAIGRALPGRSNLVLTRAPAAPFAGQLAVRSLDEALARGGGAELMVIGGGEVYALALPRAGRMYLTLVDTVTSDADTFFPAFVQHDWRETAREHHPVDAKHPLAFDFVDLERKGETGPETGSESLFGPDAFNPTLHEK